MNRASTQSKLAQLRAKTDRQLAQIVDNGLESALKLLYSVRSELVRAEKAYAEALKLLPKVDDLHERRRLKHKLVQVGKSLERLSPASEARAHAPEPDMTIYSAAQWLTTRSEPGPG